LLTDANPRKCAVNAMSEHDMFNHKGKSVDDPLVGSIAIEYLNNREEHDSQAREWTKR